MDCWDSLSSNTVLLLLCTRRQLYCSIISLQVILFFTLFNSIYQLFIGAHLTSVVLWRLETNYLLSGFSLGEHMKNRMGSCVPVCVCLCECWTGMTLYVCFFIYKKIALKHIMSSERCSTIQYVSIKNVVIQCTELIYCISVDNNSF